MNKTENISSANTKISSEESEREVAKEMEKNLARLSKDNPNEVYEIFLKSYKALPEEIVNHRKYFASEGRGFGEDAFHAMWYYLFKNYLKKKRFISVLEIGVFRGQTLSLFSLLAKHFNIPAEVWGISPLAAVNDSVSQFPTDIDYEKDININYAFLNLGKPNLLKASSLDKFSRNFIKTKYWDVIYIDGNHDLPFVISDYMNCADQLCYDGLLVIDDSSLYTTFEREGSFKGHVGPSQVVEHFARNEFKHLLQVGHNNVFTFEGPSIK